MQFCSGLVSDVKLQQNANLARNLTGSQEVSAGRFRDASIALGIDLEVRASIAAVTGHPKYGTIKGHPGGE